MAISIRSISTGSDNGGTASVSVVTSESPLSTQVGHVLILVHGNDFYAASNMPTPTVSPGSPTVTAITNGAADAGSNLAHLKSYTVLPNTAGAQTGSVTETGSHDEEKSMFAVVLAGVDTSNIIDVAANSSGTSSTSHVAPAVTTSTSDAFLICIAHSGGGAAAASYTAPGSMSNKTEIHVGGLSAVMATEQLSASGSTGTRTFTAASSVPWAAITIAVRTAAVTAAVAVEAIVVTQQAQPSPTRATILRSTLADPPVLTTSPPIVTTRPAQLPAPTTILAIRSTLADPPVLTTAAPLVVTRPAPFLTPPPTLLSRSSFQDYSAAAPIVVSRPATAPPATTTFLSRSSLADAAAPTASTPPPIVVSGTSVRPPLGSATVLRSTLVDPPVLATPEPLVVSAPTKAVQPASVISLRGSLVDLATPGPIVVSAPSPLSRTGPAFLSRSSLADPPVVTGVATPGPIVVTFNFPPLRAPLPQIMSAFRPGTPATAGQISGDPVSYPGTDTDRLWLAGQEESGAVSSGASASLAVSAGIQ